jgi:hypothetical protein
MEMIGMTNQNERITVNLRPAMCFEHDFIYCTLCTPAAEQRADERRRAELDAMNERADCALCGLSRMTDSLDDWGRCNGCQLWCAQCNNRAEHLDDDERCDDCVTMCENCNDPIPQWASYTVAEQIWCESCYSNNGAMCADCGYTYDTSQTGTYCEDCDESLCGDDPCAERHVDRCPYRDTDGIHNYSYVPQAFNFLGHGPRYMGVELEIDGAGESGEHAREILNFSDEEQLFYIKSDSSLDSGLEIVTHPATLAHHMDVMPWQEITDTARALGYRSHSAGTCGLHVHVSRAALGRSFKAQELTVSRLLILIWRHWAELWKFSRRRSDNWCRQQYHEDKVSRYGLDDAKQQGRYTALNLTNDATIEFRLFRGTLNMTTLRATLQLVDVLLDVSKTRSIAWIARSSWLDIIEAGFQHPELMTYLDKRGLAYGPLSDQILNDRRGN